MSSCRHNFGWKLPQAGSPIPNSSHDDYIPCSLFLQFRKQLGKLAEDTQFRASSNGVLSARGRQNEYQRAVEALFLKPQLAGPLRKVFVRGFTIEGDHL